MTTLKNVAAERKAELVTQFRDYLRKKGFRVKNVWCEEHGIFAHVDTWSRKILPFVTQVWGQGKYVTVRLSFSDLEFINE